MNVGKEVVLTYNKETSYPDISLKGMKETAKFFSQLNWSPKTSEDQA
jgi:hypothetical protein